MECNAAVGLEDIGVFLGIFVFSVFGGHAACMLPGPVSLLMCCCECVCAALCNPADAWTAVLQLVWKIIMHGKMYSV